MSPADWRRKPSHIQIEAPSSVHFHPPGGLRLPAKSKVGLMDLLTKMVEHHIWLVGQMGMWNAALASRAYDWSLEDHESIASMRERLAVEGPTYLSQVREVCEQGRLDGTFVDALCEPAEVFTYAGMIAHVLTFAAHRRTLVVLALDAAGIKDLGWGDPMKWVAEPST